MDSDRAYINANFIADADSYPPRWAEDAAAHRALEQGLGRAYLNLSYGSGERQAYDLFYPAGRPEGLLVFVHGGYWRRFHRTDWSHFSSGATARGWAVAVPSYTLAPTARISEITQEIAQAIAAAAARIAGPIMLTGHSAGGHLVARMVQQGGALDQELLGRVQKCVPISPVSDLRPLVSLAMNADLRLDAAEAEAESPVLAQPPASIPVSVWVGGAESPVFLEQARWLAEAWGSALHAPEGRHHFDIIDGLRDPDNPMMQDLIGDRPGSDQGA